MYPHKKKFDTRTPKVKFVVSVEGGVTEKEYFERIGKLFYKTVILDVPKDVNKSSPNAVLGRMDGYRKSLKSGDQLWCVIDLDRWQKHLSLFDEWVKKAKNGIPRHLGLSNPKIELWILWHLMEWDPAAKKVPGILKSLLKQMPGYDKHLDVKKITIESVQQAVSRGKRITPDGKPPLAVKGSNFIGCNFAV